MDRKKLIEIWKDLVYKAWIYSKITDEKEKKDLLALFDGYEKELKTDKSKYAQTVLWFVIDLKGDLLSWRELKIDNTLADEYINSYFVTTREVKYFNLLLNEKIFNSIFEQVNKKEIDKNIISTNVIILDSTFRKTLKKLSSDVIAKNLLIFTLFNTNKPIPALKRLVLSLSKKQGFEKEVIILKKLIITYKKIIVEVKEKWIKILSKKDFNFKYLKFSNNTEDWKVSVDIKISDASKEDFRSHNPEFEYRNILKKL